jgi:hypothetical protein
MSTPGTSLSRKGRAVRELEVEANEQARLANLVEDIFEDRLDVAVIRNAFPPAPLERASAQLERPSAELRWARPNEPVPEADIKILGTLVPATPSFTAPRGPSFDAYLAASAQTNEADQIFGTSFDAKRAIGELLRRCSGAKEVTTPSTSDGRSYAPYTLRLLSDGKKIPVHNDNYYDSIAMYGELAARVDKKTLMSYFVIVQAPTAGGELTVFGLTSGSPEVPMKSAYQYDAEAIQRDFAQVILTPKTGDLVLLAAGRCFHTVNTVVGPRSRITLGAFMGFDRGHSTLLYWS